MVYVEEKVRKCAFKGIVMVKTFSFIITTTKIKQMHEVENNTINRAQSHS
jgi:hypothetical protein